MEPPLFPTGGPQTVRAAPGSAADLLLPVPFGSPPFQYDWSRAGATLDERFIVSDDAGGVRLTVSAARTGDSGVYTLQACNAAGKDTTRVRLEVSPDETPVGEDPPNFLRRLQDLTVKVGTRTRFLVEIVSSTECKVTWYRNERRLMETERVALVRDGNFWCADVATVSVDDAGRWTCTAENVGGRASCSAHLNVLVPKAYKRPEFVEELRALLTEQGTVSLECKVVGVPTPVLRWFKDSREIKAGDVFALTANAEDPTSLGTYTCEAVNCMGRAYSSSKVHVVGRASREGSARPSSGGLTPDPPPIFTKELEDQFVRICDPLTLNCHIVVPPWPRSVVWYNKEGKIEPSERYHVLEDGVGGYLLEVSSAEWADEGEWKCVASTAGGRVGMSSCYVSMDVPKNYRKPRFMENLQAVLTEEGLVSFECKVVGFPTPVLSWFKDGQELKPGDVYQLTGTNSLGSYCCIARNCMGQASSSAELTVEDIQNQLNEEEKHQLFSKNQAPKFLQGLKSVEAKIDEPFRFTIKVAIPPEPTLLWYRDDQPVDESSRCHHGKEERGVFYLDIQNLEFLDQAEWKCVAMNDFGQSVTSCFLKLIIPRHYKKPRFLENLQAILSDEGAVNLECKVIGVPQPVLKWYKDGEELKPGDIHRIISGQDGTCCLGTYTCEAQNCMGIAASSASLLGFDDSLKTKSKKKSEEQTLQRNLSLSTIHEERTSQMYDTPLGDRTLDDKGEISFSFDGKEVSVSLYETPDLTEEEALQIVEMYADQLSENVTEHNVVELPPLRFVKETSTSGNLLMEAIIIDVSPEYFTSPEEDLRTEADIEDISIADENGPPQISLDQDFEIAGPDYLEKTMALLSDEKADMPKKLGRKKSDSQRSADDYFSLSRDQSLSDDKKDDDTQVLSESDLQSFASARSSEKRKASKPSLEELIPLAPQTLEITKTIREDQQDDVVKPKDIEPEVSASKAKRERRRSRSSRRSSSGSDKSVEKIKDELGHAEIEQPSKKLIADDEYRTKINNIGIYLSKLINDIQIIERDIILQSELMSSAATASKSLEIIGSLITPLSEMHSIVEAAKESATFSPEINSTLFINLPQPFKELYQSLTIIEKCIDVESDSKTLVKKTCVSLIEKCGNDIQKAVSEMNSLISKKYLDVGEKLISDIEATSNEMITIIRFSTDTIKTRSLLHEASEFKPDEPSLEIQHSKDTQKAIFELKSPLQSLLRIVESTERDHLIDGSNVKNSEIILEDMSTSIQHLQEALEQIESLSVKESTTPLITYNTEIIETVMDSILKLRTSFEQLSTEAKKEENENVLKEVLYTIKLNLNELSSHIDTFEQKVGKFDILQSENKLEVLQKMAQMLISFENNLPVLEAVQGVKNHMVKLHKNLTKVLENVIESNDASKYFAFMEICDSINRVNSSVKNIELHDIFTLTSINNTLRIIQDHFIQNLFEPELNCAILSNIEDIQINLLDNINIAEENSLKTESERIQDLALTKKEESKACTVLESINHSIAAISKVVTEEQSNDLKSALAPVFESIQPNLVDLKQKVASMIAVDIEREDHASEISDVSLTNTLAEPLFELNQNIAVLNQTLIENVNSLKENSIIAMTYAQPLHELQTTIETLQHEVISQCGEDILPYELSSKMANVVQKLQNCIVLIQEQSGVETADEMSTLEDVSGIKTTTEIMPIDHLILPTTEEVLPELFAETLKSHQPELVTAETLQALHEHVELMQVPDIIEFLESLSENSDYTSLKSVAVSLGELNEGVQEIFHPIQMENSNELLDSLNTSKLIEIAEPIQDLRQSLSVVATSDIPIYESFLKIPAEKIHSAIEKITEFKDHLERCLKVIIPAIETTEEMVEISSNIDLIKKMCTDLNIIFQDSERILTCISPEVSSFKQKLNNFLEATNMQDINEREVKSLTENLYAELLLVQDELIKSTPQPSETIAQEIKLIESVQELENKIAVLEQFHFVDLSCASDMESCISPQLAVEIETDSLNNIDNLVNHVANVVQDAGGKTSTADLMILEDFFKTCKLEFSILRCLIKKRPTHKKIIRLLQEFSFLRSIITDFKEKRFQLFVPEDIKDLLSDFMLNLDMSMKDIEKSLIKIVNLQSKVLIELPMRILQNNTKTITDVTKNNKIPADLEQQFVKLVEYICPHFGTLQTAIIKELQGSEISSILAVEKNTVIEQVDNFFAVLEEQMLKIDNEEQKQVIEKVLSCSQKHQDYKDVTGQSKMLLILKCLAECSTILNEQLINDADETTLNEDILRSPEVVTLQSVLLEMVQPLQGLRDQVVSIQEQISSGVDEESVSVDVTSTESYVQVLTDIHKNVVQIIESEKPVLEEADLSLIETLDNEFQTIQESIQSVTGPADVIKQITSHLEEIEKSLHLVKEKGIVETQITVSKEKAEALLQHIDQYIEFVEIVEEESAILKIGNFLETAKIAKELRESIDNITKVTEENDTEIKLSSDQDSLMNKLHRALSSLQEHALDSVLEMVPSFDDYKRRHVMEVVATLQADLLAITSIQVAIIAPSDSTTEQLQLAESRISDAVEKQEKASEKQEKIEKRVVADEVSKKESSELISEAPQKMETLDLDVKKLTESENEIPQYLEVAENLGTIDAIKHDASILDAEKLKQADITKTSVIEPDGNDNAIEFGQVENINAFKTEESSPTTLSIGTLVQHIKEYLSEDVIKTIAYLGTISDYTKLEESLNVANKLHESIIALEVLPMESITLLQNEEYAGQKEMVLHLQEELDVLNELTLSKAEELKAVIGEKSLESFAEVVQNLQADIVFIVSPPLIMQISKQIDVKEDEVPHMKGSNPNIPIPQDEQMLAIEVPERVTKDEVKTQTLDIKTAPEKSTIKEPAKEKTDQCPDMEDIDSINKLETLLSEVTNQVNLSSADITVDDTELLRNILDEVQTVIIKLKFDFDETVNDTLNETLEDLECSVRSVQLQIDENSPPELLKDACATLQLLVNNMSDIKDQVTNPPKEKDSKEMLQKCFVSTEQTIKLLDDASKADSDVQLLNVISKLKLLKDTLKILSLNFRGDACSLINNGVEVIQSLDQMEEQIFALEKDIEAVTTKTDVKDSIVVAVHTVYENISNMRSTLSSIQKEYMYENYAKPSENFLRSLKNISFLYDRDRKCNWKHLRKVLRQALNHFEDIKFYVNFDKTARIPSDAAFTKIILDELFKELNEVFLANVIESYPEMSNKVYEVLAKVKESNDSLQTRTTIEVKEKIPLFKMISEELVQLTNAIRKYVEGQTKTETEAISEGIELGEEKRTDITETLEQYDNEAELLYEEKEQAKHEEKEEKTSSTSKENYEECRKTEKLNFDNESINKLEQENAEESDTLKTDSKGLEIPQSKEDIKVMEVGILDAFVQEQRELAIELDETVEAGEAEKDITKMKPALETKEVEVLDEGQSENQKETVQIQTKLDDSDQQAKEYKNTHDAEETARLGETKENVLKASEAETDTQFPEFTAEQDEEEETENKTKEVKKQEQAKVVSRDEEKQICKDNVSTEETKDEKLKEEDKKQGEEQGGEEKLQEEKDQSTQKQDNHTVAKAAEDDQIKNENKHLDEAATSQKEQDIVQEKEILQSDEEKKDTKNLIDETLLQNKKEIGSTEKSKLSENATVITAKVEVDQEKLGQDTIVLNEPATPDVKQMLEEDIDLEKETRDDEMKELDKNVISYKKIEQHKSTSIEMGQNIKDGEDKQDDKKHIEDETTLQKVKDILDAEAQNKKEKKIEKETEEAKIKDDEQSACLEKQRQGAEKKLLVEDAKSQKDETEIFEKEKQDAESKKEEEEEDVFKKKVIEEKSKVRKEKETEEGGLEAKNKETRLEAGKKEDKKEQLDEEIKSQTLKEATDTKRKDDEKSENVQGAEKELHDMEGMLQMEKKVEDAKQKEEVENDQLEKETKIGIPEHLDKEAKLSIDKEGGGVKQTEKEKEIEDNVSKFIDESAILQKREEIFNTKQKPEEYLKKEIVDAETKDSLENDGHQKRKEAEETKQSGETENIKKDKTDGEKKEQMKQKEDEDTLCVDKEKREVDKKRNEKEARLREEEKGDNAKQKTEEEKLGHQKESQETKNKCLNEEAVLRKEKDAYLQKKVAENKKENEKQQADEEILDNEARQQKAKEEFESKQTAEEEKLRLEQDMKDAEKRLLDEEAKFQKGKDESDAKQKIEEEKLSFHTENQEADKHSVHEEARLQKEREKTVAKRKSVEETQQLENETQEAEIKRIGKETRLQKEKEDIEAQQKTEEEKQLSEKEKHEDEKIDEDTKLHKEKEKLRIQKGKQERLLNEKEEADAINKAEEEKLEKEKQVSEKKHLDEEVQLPEKIDSEAKHKAEVKLLQEQENQEVDKKRFQNEARLQKEKGKMEAKQEAEFKTPVEKENLEAEKKRIDEEAKLQEEKNEAKSKMRAEKEKQRLEKETQETDKKRIDEESKSLIQKEEIGAKNLAQEKKGGKENQEEDKKRHDEGATLEKEKEDAYAKNKVEEEKLEKEKQEAERKRIDDEAISHKEKEAEAKKKAEAEKLEKEKQEAEKKGHEEEARLQKEKEDADAKKKADEEKLRVEKEKQEAKKKHHDEKATLDKEKEDADAKKKVEKEKLEKEKQEAERKSIDEEAISYKEKEDADAKKKVEKEKLEKEKQEAERKRIDEEAISYKEKEAEAKKKAEAEKLEKEKQEAEKKRQDKEAGLQKEEEDADAKKKAEKEKLEKENQDSKKKRDDEEAKLQKQKEAKEAKKKAEEEIEKEKHEAEMKRHDEDATLEKEKDDADAKKKEEEEKLEKEKQEAERKRIDEEATSHKEKEAENKKNAETEKLEKEKQEAEKKRHEEEARLQKEKEDADAKKKAEEEKLRLEKEKQETEKRRHEEEARLQKEKEDADAKKKADEEKLRVEKEKQEAKKKHHDEKATLDKEKDDANAKKKLEEEKLEKEKQEAERKRIDEEAISHKEKEAEAKKKADAEKLEKEKQEAEKKGHEEEARLQKEKEDADAKKKADEEKLRVEKEKQEAKKKHHDEKATLDKEKEDADTKKKVEEEKVEKEKQEAERKRIDDEAISHKEKEAEAKKKAEAEKLEKEKQEAEKKGHEEEARLQKEKEDADAKKKADEEKLRVEKEKQEAKKKHHDEKATLDKEKEDADAKKKAEEENLGKEKQEAERKRIDEEAISHKEKEAEAKKKAEAEKLEKKKQEAEKKGHEEEARLQKEKENADAKKKADEEKLRVEKEKQEAEKKRQDEEARLQKEEEDADAKKKVEKEKLEKESQDSEKKRHDEKGKLQKQKEEAKAKKKAEEEELEKEKQEAEMKGHEEEARLQKEKEDADAKKKADEEKLRVEKEKQEAKKKHHDEKATLDKEKEDADAKKKAEEENLGKEKQEAERKRIDEEAISHKEKEAEAKKKAEAEKLEKEKQEAEKKGHEEEARLQKEKENADAKKKADEEKLRVEKEKQEAEKKRQDEEARLQKEEEDADAKKKVEKEKLEKESQDSEKKRHDEKGKLQKQKEEAKAKKKAEEEELEKEKQEAEMKHDKEAKLQKENEEAVTKQKAVEEKLEKEKHIEAEAGLQKEKESKAKQKVEQEKLRVEKEKQEAEKENHDEEARMQKEKESGAKLKAEEETLQKEKQQKEKTRLDEEARLQKEKEDSEAKQKAEEQKQREEKEKQDSERKRVDEEVKLQKETEEADAKKKAEKEKQQLEKEKQEAEKKRVDVDAKLQKELEVAETKKKDEEEKLEKEKQEAKRKRFDAEASLQKEKEADAKQKEDEEKQRLEKEKQEAKETRVDDGTTLQREKEETEAKQKAEVEKQHQEKEKLQGEKKRTNEDTKSQKEKEGAEAKKNTEKEKQQKEKKRIDEELILQKEKENSEAKLKAAEEEKQHLEKEKQDAEKKRFDEEVKLQKEKEEADSKKKAEEEKQRLEKEKQEAEKKRIDEEANLQKENLISETKQKEEVEKQRLEKEKQEAKKNDHHKELKLKKEKEEADAKKKSGVENQSLEDEDRNAETKLIYQEAKLLDKDEVADVEQKKQVEKLEEESKEAEKNVCVERSDEEARLQKEKQSDALNKEKEGQKRRSSKKKQDREKKRSEEQISLQKEMESAADLRLREEETARRTGVESKTEDKDYMVQKDSEQKEKLDAEVDDKKEIRKKRLDKEVVELNQKDKVDEMYERLSKKEKLMKSGQTLIEDYSESEGKHKKAQKEEDKDFKKYEDGMKKFKKDSVCIVDEQGYRTEGDPNKSTKINGSAEKYKSGEIDISSISDLKHDLKEKSHFINYNNNNIDLEMYKPPGYIKKKYDENDKYLLLDLDSSSKIPTTYKAQSLGYQAQLRSTTPQQFEMDRTSEIMEKRIDIRQRSKALSEAKSALDKRVGTSRDHKRKPVFSTYLTDRTAVEASRVKLTCSVLSSIDPMITWYKNGVLLDNKFKYRTKFVDGLITLEVLNAVPSDSAEYTCTVKNENGSVSTSANLKVYPSFEASPIPPTFTRSIRDTYHLAENELVLECRIRGQPLPTITWFKDDRLISSDERYQAYYLADGVCRLAISAPTTADSGKYTCKAENSMWSDQITHVVNFTGRESHLGPNLATIEKSRFNRQAIESRRPHFTNVLADYKVTRGGTIGLQVEIKGSPTRVEWLREGCSVTEIYRNALTFVEHGLYTLALADVTEKESGLYTCRAWSSHGNVDMNAAITVVQPNELEGKPAIIVGRPQKDVLISVGEDLNISFRVQGDPKPKVIFMKGIRDITNSQRVCKMTSDDYVKFTLKRSVVSDAGTYCILARNAYGCDRAFVTVVIRQRASSENLISDWTYPQDDTVVSIAERKYKSVPDRIPGEPSVVDGGNNWVSLAWQKPDQQTCAPVLAYKVESWLLGKEGGARWIELGITPLNSFDVFNLKQGEEYHFRVTPRNRYGWGEAVQTSNPIVIGLSGERPEFTETLPGQLKVLVGETANLSCSFKGKPTPEIIWMKNGHEIEEVDDRIKTLLNGFDCCLTIKDVQIEDEARYSCEASNVHGRASTYARMAVITDRLVWEADAKLKRERSAGVEGEYPPQFTMRLRDRRVQATYPVRLTCQVIGSPAPVVTWFKDGHKVAYDSRHNKYQDEHFHTLEIAPTSLEDGGVYEAMARNSSGAVSCRCSLVVDKGIRAYVAPEFCCGLEPLYRLYEGEELRISAMVEAYPSVGVTWYRDGVRLRPSRRAVMTLDHDGQIELALASITKRDAGVYTCTASNEVGRASTSGKVEVVGGDHAEDKPATPPVVISPDDPYSKEPMFIRKPRSSEAYEGDTVIIECEVIGDPKPDVYWLRDFLKPDYYRDANHFKRVGAGPEYRFEIPHAKLDYTGTYSVVARNEHGEAKAIISLQILAKDITASDDAHNVRYGRVDVIPRFDKELTDLLCYDGDAIEFECRVSGNPEPCIKWLHYNEVIRDCPDFETSFEEGTARLKIKQVTAEDEGTYTCEAFNHLGKAKSSACLVVYPPGEPNTLSQRLRRPPALLSAASTPRSTPRATPARSMSRTPGPDARRLCSPSREIAPKFYTYPFNKVVEEGERVVFKCAVQGLPNPWATWDKDGIVITPTSRITIREKDEMLRILEIEEVTIEDVGLYRITLENDYGRAEASARLEVISHKGKFYGGVRSCSASPRRTLYRRRTPSTSRQD